jgi:predicted dehydrogenase
MFQRHAIVYPHWKGGMRNVPLGFAGISGWIGSAWRSQDQFASVSSVSAISARTMFATTRPIPAPCWSRSPTSIPAAPPRSPAATAPWFPDHRGLIGRVDAVSVTAPTSAHHAIAGDLIDAGIHVFVEKPIAADVASAADLVARAERAGTRLQVGHIEALCAGFPRASRACRRRA